MVTPLSFRSFAILLGATFALVGISPAKAQSVEQSVKAAFVTKFSRYVEWPGSGRPAGQAVEICIVGSDPFGRLIDQAARSDPSAMVVRRLDKVEQARSCAVAFLAGTAQQPTAAMVTALRGSPVLTVTDARFGPAKGMIHFDVRGGKVGFHINDVLAAQSRLTISSRLLQLALSVRQRPR